MLQTGGNRVTIPPQTRPLPCNLNRRLRPRGVPAPQSHTRAPTQHSRKTDWAQPTPLG